jgi:hypothetical protein
MGKKYQLSTPLLRRDYIEAAELLRKHAARALRRIAFYKRIAPRKNERSEAVLKLDAIFREEIKRMRALARRFKTRADRMPA